MKLVKRYTKYGLFHVSTDEWFKRILMECFEPDGATVVIQFSDSPRLREYADTFDLFCEMSPKERENYLIVPITVTEVLGFWKLSMEPDFTKAERFNG